MLELQHLAILDGWRHPHDFQTLSELHTFAFAARAFMFDGHAAALAAFAGGLFVEGPVAHYSHALAVAGPAAARDRTPQALRTLALSAFRLFGYQHVLLGAPAHLLEGYVQRVVQIFAFHVLLVYACLFS